MSLDLINHKLTTSTTDETGVITWSNPAIDVVINSNGQVLSIVGTKKRQGVANKQFSFKYLELNKRSLATFNSLYSRMVLGIELYRHTIKLINKCEGYVEGNIVILPNKFIHSKIIAPQDMEESLNKFETNAERKFYTQYLEGEHENFYSTRTIQRYKKSFLLKYDLNIYTPKY